ncbi:hypothetical protein TSUD_150220 [Trifolium subterraneum]|uniref:Replication factor A C-terminal domain-containing protein n=1 Tax=Trifolium subterraneum TaxID=3900 RepID=A0A2Z6P3P0_TRISU|nr:hypothetical protein TSUD_150220 [Trifolium subterraneum]
MRNFKVGVNDYQFKMSDHKCKLTFSSATRVSDLEIPNIPKTAYNFKDIAEVLKGNFRTDLLVDVHGVVCEIGKVVIASGSKKGNVAFKIKDLRCDNVLDCTLWDSLSASFLDIYNSRGDFDPLVLIMKHARVKEPQGLYPLQFTNAWNGTKLLFDENIPEIKTFKNSLPQSTPMSVLTQNYTQSSGSSFYNADHLFMKNARALRLAEMKSLRTDTICVTVVKTSHIRISNQGWFFRSCRDCNKKAEGLEPPFICNLGHKSNDPIVKYKLDVEVCDGDEIGKFIFWDNTLDELLGITAADLLKDMEKLGTSDPQDYPEIIEDMMDRTFAFRVKWQHSWGQATVVHCKDNEELIAKIQEQLPNAETSVREIEVDTPIVKPVGEDCDSQPAVQVSDPQPIQTFTAEDISKFDNLDDDILSTPNVSVSAETESAASTQKTPAKRTARQKSYDDKVESAVSSTKSVKHIKKEKNV